MSAPTLASEIVDAVRALPLAVSVPMVLTTVTILVVRSRREGRRR